MSAVEFLIISLIVVLIPGTGVVFTVPAGLTQGRRASLFASIGCTRGIVPHLLAHAFRKAVIESARVQAWLRWGFAAAFAGLGAQLAASER